MNASFDLRPSGSGFAWRRARAQRGVALVVALILLVLITLVGLAAVHGTFLQQKMTTSFYDRQIAFQDAEAALREANALIPTTPSIVWHDCQAGGIVCLPNPFNDPNLPTSAIKTVATGTSAGDYTVGAAAASQPQYVVEDMGNWVDQNNNTGTGDTANSRQYGAQGASGTAVYYRITARSGDPAVVGERAVVTIQAIVKQG